MTVLQSSAVFFLSIIVARTPAPLNEYFIVMQHSTRHEGVIAYGLFYIYIFVNEVGSMSELAHMIMC